MVRTEKTLSTVFWALAFISIQAKAQVTPGYPERVLQWTVQPGETCENIASALYGAASHVKLLLRYNDIECVGGNKLPAGLTLVVPERVTDLPAATVQSLSPEVRARLAGSDWLPAVPGMSLHRNDSVNTLERARADILFSDRTRIAMAEHTLVVVYETATQSRLTQKRPSSILLEEGELQTVISALRHGSGSEVAIKGGAHVSAQSKDSVVRTRSKLTTVSVFDGSARVQSGGVEVKVPALHGTSFQESRPPSPARPLPAAPAWAADCSRGTVLAPQNGGLIAAHWENVPKSKLYRIEVARDPEFQTLIIREEIPATITSFRAEGMPTGSYYVRVRAIDTDDFLGLASESLAVDLVTAKWSGRGAALDGSYLKVSPYSVMQFTPMQSVQLALDDGAFGTVPNEIDFARLHPAKLRFRRVNETPETVYGVQYKTPRVEPQLVKLADGYRIMAVFSNVDDEDLWSRLQPAVRVVSNTGTNVIALKQSTNAQVGEAMIRGPVSEPFRVEVVDSGGKTLANLVSPRDVPTKVVTARETDWATGPCSPLMTNSTVTSVMWWAPSSCNAVTTAATVSEVSSHAWSAQGSLRASGMLGPVGIEALLQTNTSNDEVRSDDAAWLGAKWRALALQNGWSLGPAVRLGLSPTSGSKNDHLELGLAASWQGQRFGWITDLGLRSRFDHESQQQFGPSRHYFLLTGTTFSVANWLVSYLLLDTHLTHDGTAEPWAGRGGLTLGLETRSPLFAGLGVRVSPWEDAGGRLAGQLAIGLRR